MAHKEKQVESPQSLKFILQGPFSEQINWKSSGYFIQIQKCQPIIF